MAENEVAICYESLEVILGIINALESKGVGLLILFESIVRPLFLTDF